jgi:hypothetical protein
MAEIRTSLLDISRSFVPRILVDFLTNNVKNGKGSVKASSFFLHGVCLIVDISGFTALSEAFCDAGKKGIDGLQVCTNGYIGELVNVVHSHGGDIIKFAGDALICIFTDLEQADRLSELCEGKSTGSVSVDVILRAMMCATTIREVRTDRLTVHVGMSCGEMCFGILGGVENRWECLISGPCIYQLSQCLDDASSMQAVMTAACADILFSSLGKKNSIDTGDATVVSSDTTRTVSLWAAGTGTNYEVELEYLRSENFRITSISRGTTSHLPEVANSPSPAVRPDAAKRASIVALVHQFVPAPIVEELDSATGLSYFAEIREVVTMFMKVKSSHVCNCQLCS